MKWFIVILVFALAAILTLLIFRIEMSGGGHPPRWTLEIDHLSQAMNAYKEEQIQFPPCMADAGSRQGKERFMKHIQLAWVNAVTYTASVAGYDETNRKVRDEAKYNFAKPDGSIDTLNMDNLDPAESLVFWLGGFPTPVDPTTKQPVASRKLFGFHRDSDDPFKRDPPGVEGLEPMRYRTEPKFMFDPLRLVDNDGDGWLEFVPFSPEEGKLHPPYVYFDARTYAATTGFSNGTGMWVYPRDSKLVDQWGTAQPYLTSFDRQRHKTSYWANDRSFQIICAGLDGKYGPPTPRLVIFPSLDTFDAADGYQKPHAVDKTELDNLTNLSHSTLQTAKQMSGP